MRAVHPKPDQAAGLRRLVGRNGRELPLASVLSREAHEALLARLAVDFGCRVRELEAPEDWLAVGSRDVAVALDDDAQSVTAAYMLIKAAAARHGHRRFQLLFAGIASRFDPQPAITRIARAAGRFVGAEVTLAGVLAPETLTFA